MIRHQSIWLIETEQGINAFCDEEAVDAYIEGILRVRWTDVIVKAKQAMEQEFDEGRARAIAENLFDASFGSSIFVSAARSGIVEASIKATREMFDMERRAAMMLLTSSFEAWAEQQETPEPAEGVLWHGQPILAVIDNVVTPLAEEPATQMSFDERVH